MYEDDGGPSNVRNGAENGSTKERFLSTKDSKFVGLSIAVKKSLNACFSHWDPVKCPLLLLFPDLRKKSVDMEAIVKGTLPPEDITRKLIGKMADFTYFKKSIQQKKYNYEDHLPTILEEQVFLFTDHKHRGNL